MYLLSEVQSSAYINCLTNSRCSQRCNQLVFFTCLVCFLFVFFLFLGFVFCFFVCLFSFVFCSLRCNYHVLCIPTISAVFTIPYLDPRIHPCIHTYVHIYIHTYIHTCGRNHKRILRHIHMQISKHTNVNT